MVIKASSSKHIDALVADLSSDRVVTREAAIANLTISGARAVDRLASLVGDATARPAARIAALRVLEGIDASTSLDVALNTLNNENDDVAVAAIAVAGSFVKGRRGVKAVDRLTSVTLDPERADAVRVAALRTLAELTPSTLKPLYQKLRDDRSPALAAIGKRGRVNFSPVPFSLPDPLPDDPDALRHLIAINGKSAPLSDLQRLVTQVADRERTESGTRRMAWMTVRGAAHAALASRKSRLALYDLRETIESATQAVPVEFLAALQQIGDASCLEAIAAAYARASKRSSGEEWWRRHLVDAFHDITKREKITKRHAVMKRIEKRWPAILS